MVREPAPFSLPAGDAWILRVLCRQVRLKGVSTGCVDAPLRVIEGA